jgi:hypothetical protein
VASHAGRDIARPNSAPAHYRGGPSACGSLPCAPAAAVPHPLT